MPGVQFPFSTATEDERLAAISNQIGKCAPDVFSPAAFLIACLSVGQPKHAPASAACSRKAVLTSSFAKAELRAQLLLMHPFIFFAPVVLMLLHSYADVMLAEAIHMLFVRVGPSPFQPFSRLLAVHSHITQTPAIAQ